jgi:hypothetical protein
MRILSGEVSDTPKSNRICSDIIEQMIQLGVQLNITRSERVSRSRAYEICFVHSRD